MEFTILGQTSLQVGATKVDLGAKKQRALLALLLLQVKRPVPVETIIQALWPGKVHDGVRSNLQSLMSRIRGALARAGVEYRVTHEGETYRLDLDQNLVDYHRFLRMVEAGRAASATENHAEAKLILTEAIGLWRGVPLADIRGEWAAKRRNDMESIDLLHAHHALLQARVELREYAGVMRDLVPLLEQHPHDDTLARIRMTALDGMGDRHGATSFYMQFRRRLANEFGTETSAELDRLYHRLLTEPPTGEPDHAARSAAPVDARPYRFPRQVPGFTGRLELLRRLDSFLDAGPADPIVALHGMPGVGKTELAVHWAHRHRDDFPDGMVLLDMRGYGSGRPLTPDHAISMLLDRLGVPADQIPVDPGRRPVVLSRALANRRTLLVLDNVRDAEQVLPLLDVTSDCFMLLTSRDRLRFLAIREGAHTLAVPEMNVEESLDLLRSTIKDDRAADDERGLLEIARLSNGLPLALKITGRHIADRPRETPGQLAEQLKAHRDLLFLDEEDEEAISLSAVFSWSYEALVSDAARLFRLMGLHPGSRVSGECTAALAGTSSREAARLLANLARVNLLDHDVANRYRIHDLLREYAAGRAQECDSPGARRDAIERLLTWYVLTSAEACGRLSPQSPPIPALPTPVEVIPLLFATDQDALDWCALERENLVAATRLASAHGFHEHAWRIPAAVQEVFERSGYHDDLLTSHELALGSARATGQVDAEIGTLNNLGLMYLNVHRVDEAFEHLLAGLDIAREQGHRPGEAVCLHNLGTVHFERGDDRKALELYGRALEINHELGGGEGEAFGHHRIGMAHHRSGNLAEAKRSFDEALRIRVEIGHVRGQGATLTALAALHQALGEPDRALEHCQRALRIHRLTGDRIETGHALMTLAAIEFDHGDLGSAHDHAAEAASLADELHDVTAQARCLHLLGRVMVFMGQERAAAQAWRQALSLFLSTNDPTARVVQAHLDSIRERPDD
ncbi:tetratricopeptide repeat protein [Saccharothrix sp. BKS2]|uniref:AfsR/SARP family transcriptional regulator n=1 Tax=Saccharothrix sp. BKS2 TaxID=3064400 RepID=UPI0039EAA746